MNTEVIYVSGTGNTAAVAKEIFQALPSSHRKTFRNWTGPETPSPPTVISSASGPIVALPASRSWIFYRSSTEKRWPFSAPAAWEIPRNTTRSWKTRSAPFSRTTMNTSAAFSAREKCPSGCVKNTKLCSAPSMTSWPAGSSKISMKRFFIPLLRISEKPLLLPKTSVKKWRQFYEG